ncbi:MAG: hypothetical protein ACOWW1_05615 [archaeon]
MYALHVTVCDAKAVTKRDLFLTFVGAVNGVYVLTVGIGITSQPTSARTSLRSSIQVNIKRLAIGR